MGAAALAGATAKEGEPAGIGGLIFGAGADDVCIVRGARFYSR